MDVAACIAALEAIAPPALAESWDNVGLIVGDPTATLERAMLAIDCTPAVVDEAAAAGAGLIVAYHPPIFRPLRRLAPGHAAARALASGIAIYSPHTALDAAAGGVNDVLAGILGLGEVRPLRPAAAATAHQLTFFAPRAATPEICAALFAAGAGADGAYAECRFTGEGVGHFRPLPGAAPAIGAVGEPTQVDEARTELLVPPGRVAAVVAALHAAHPYEVPAYNLVARLPVADAPTGAGRIGTVAATSVAALADRLRAGIGQPHLLLGGDPDRRVERVAVAAGAGAGLLDAAAAAGAELLVTGELAHHDALRGLGLGLGLLASLHSHSERAALQPLAEAMRARLPGLAVDLAECDADPWQIA